MQDGHQRVIMWAVIGTAVTISTAAVYYFGFSLPQQNASLLELKKQEQDAQQALEAERVKIEQDKMWAEEARLAADQRAAAEEKEAVELRALEMRVSLLDCLSEAEDDYSSSWDKSCIKRNLGADCSLPIATADSIEVFRREMKDDCYRKYQ